METGHIFDSELPIYVASSRFYSSHLQTYTTSISSCPQVRVDRDYLKKKNDWGWALSLYSSKPNELVYSCPFAWWWIFRYCLWLPSLRRREVSAQCETSPSPASSRWVCHFFSLCYPGGGHCCSLECAHLIVKTSNHRRRVGPPIPPLLQEMPGSVVLLLERKMLFLRSGTLVPSSHRFEEGTLSNGKTTACIRWRRYEQTAFKQASRCVGLY